MTTTPEQSSIWIGIVEVRPYSNSPLLPEADGAFVNVLTWAVDLDEFIRKAEELMDSLQLQLLNVENAEPLAHRGLETELEEGIASIAREVRQNPTAIMYGVFHTWRGGAIQ